MITTYAAMNQHAQQNIEILIVFGFGMVTSVLVELRQLGRTRRETAKWEKDVEKMKEEEEEDTRRARMYVRCFILYFILTNTIE